MLFFRSEERVKEWCEQRGHPLRPLVSISQLWGLASMWYADRLRVDSRRPGPAEMKEVFAGLGLSGEFWNPESDRFGESTGRNDG